jgi:hypothetical protein
MNVRVFLECFRNLPGKRGDAEDAETQSIE